MAANEFVRRREVFTIRPLLFDDTWTGVLKFMMDTEEGGSYFAGAIVDSLVSQTPRASAEKTLARLSEVMSYSNRVPDSNYETINGMLAKIWPPSTMDATAFRNLPLEAFSSLLDYEHIQGKKPSIRGSVARLICSHSDRRFRNHLASGFLDDTSFEVALTINNHRCAGLKIHTGLWSALAQLAKRGPWSTDVDLICDDVKELVDGWQNNTLFELPPSETWKCYARVVISESTLHLGELRQADFIASLFVETESTAFVERIRHIVSAWGSPKIEMIAIATN
jgi:hypothetical protein